MGAETRMLSAAAITGRMYFVVLSSFPASIQPFSFCWPLAPHTNRSLCAKAKPKLLDFPSREARQADQLSRFKKTVLRHLLCAVGRQQINRVFSVNTVWGIFRFRGGDC